MSNSEKRVVIVYRDSRLDGLKRRYNTLNQARFYIESLGADFEEYVREDHALKESVRRTQKAYEEFARTHVIERNFLTNYIFSGDELVLVVGQDGLVANTLKYVKSLPVVGINPDPSLYDGILLPFDASEVKKFVKDTLTEGRLEAKEISIAEAQLSNGQSKVAVNDLFIGPRFHTSAQYQIIRGEQTEQQSSSGIIISTGLGSTGWLQSILTGAKQIAGGINKKRKPLQNGFSWDADFLYYSVREPFPSNITGAELSFGQVSADHPLSIVSKMPENGVIFSDGMIDDTIDFHSGLTAHIGLADWKGRLLV